MNTLSEERLSDKREKSFPLILYFLKGLISPNTVQWSPLRLAQSNFGKEEPVLVTTPRVRFES